MDMDYYLHQLLWVHVHQAPLVLVELLGLLIGFILLFRRPMTGLTVMLAMFIGLTMRFVYPFIGQWLAESAAIRSDAMYHTVWVVVSMVPAFALLLLLLAICFTKPRPARAAPAHPAYPPQPPAYPRQPTHAPPPDLAPEPEPEPEPDTRPPSDSPFVTRGPDAS